MMPRVLTHFVDADDVAVIQTGRRLGLGAEPVDLVFARQLPAEDHLDRDHAVQAHLAGFVHHAHAATRDFLQQLIIPEMMLPSPL